MRAFLCLFMVGTCCLASPALAQTSPKCTGWLQVEAENLPGASIELDGVLRKEVTPATLKDVRCGKHRLRVFKAMHQDASRAVQVTLGEVTTVKLKLREDFGFLNVKSDPVGALVKVDGEVLGKTPLDRQLIARGKHQVIVEMAEFETESRRVNIRRGKAESLEVKLKSNVAMLSLSAEPPEAVISLDGKKLGLGPIDWLKVDGGSHEARAEHPDHEPAVEKFTIQKGQQLAIKLAPKPHYAAVEITSQPAGALIWVDGMDLGPTPLKLERVPVGKRSLRLTHPLYREHRQTLKLKPGVAKEVKVKLKAAHASVQIRTEPTGGLLIWNGQDLGFAPLNLRVPPGTHVFRAGAADEEHGFAEKRVRLKAGHNEPILIALPGRTGTVMVETIPSGAEIEVDGVLKGKAPLKLDLPVGLRVIRARLGEKDLLGQVDVLAEKTSKVGVHLDNPERSVFIEPELAGQIKLADLRQPDDEAGVIQTDVSARAVAPVSLRRVFAWTTAGLSAAGLVAGIAVLGVGLSVEKDADDAYLEWLRVPTLANQDRYNDLDAEASDLYMGGWISLGIGAAIAGLSVYLFLSEPEVEVDRTGPEGATRGLVWSVLPEGGGVIGYQGRW